MKDKKVNPYETKFLLRINKNVKKLAEHEASKGNRSLNGHIITLVEDDLKLKGAL